MRFADNPAGGFREVPSDLRQRQALHGRERLLDELAPAPGSLVAELGAGSGEMIDLWGSRLHSFAALELVETQPALLQEARRRARAHRNVRVVAADATAYRAPQLADCVYLSYALTRIPDWVRALNNALAMLKPGGTLGIVDFYVAKTGQPYGRAQSSVRGFWSRWFAHGHLHLAQAHLSALLTLTDRARLHEDVTAPPHLPWLKAPYFIFTGVKPHTPRATAMCELWTQSAQHS